MAMSPADKQAEANADVERIACQLRLALRSPVVTQWEQLPENGREFWRSVVRNLLHRDVIRVGRRPAAERPMEGQTTIESWECDVCGEPLTQHSQACEGWTPPDER